MNSNDVGRRAAMAAGLAMPLVARAVHRRMVATLLSSWPGTPVS